MLQCNNKLLVIGSFRGSFRPSEGKRRRAFGRGQQLTETVAIRRGPTSPVVERVQRSRLAYLDGWRGLSITLVLIGHFFPVPGINLGLLGVEFFFVLSGRLMAEILFIERYPLKKFFKRRFSRIYPALLVYVLVTMVALSGSFIAFKWKAALTALTFTYNYAAILFTGPVRSTISGRSASKSIPMSRWR